MKDPKKIVEEMLAKAKELQKETSKVEVIEEVEEIRSTTLIPTITVEVEKEEYLPALPSSGLFLDKSEVISRDSILNSLAPDKSKYEALSFTPEEAEKAKRFLGKMTTGASAAVPMVCRGSACSYSEKCVHEDTLVLAVRGLVKIKDIKEGEKIYTSSDSLNIEKSTVLRVLNSGTKECVTIRTFNNNILTVTLDHHFRVSINSIIKWMTLEEILRTPEVKLLSVEPSSDLSSESIVDFFEDFIIEVSKPFESQVYDLTVKTNSNFIANNLLVHNCDFYQMDKVEVGETCLLEENLIEYWTAKYFDEFDIDMNSITELHTVSRLVEITIKEMRMNLYTSIHEQDLMQDFITSVDEAGNEIVNKGVSTAHTIREQLCARKFKILESLNATREKKAKLQLGAASLVSEQSGYSKLRNTVEQLANQLAIANAKKVVKNE